MQRNCICHFSRFILVLGKGKWCRVALETALKVCERLFYSREKEKENFLYIFSSSADTSDKALTMRFREETKLFLRTNYILFLLSFSALKDIAVHYMHFCCTSVKLAWHKIRMIDEASMSAIKIAL